MKKVLLLLLLIPFNIYSLSAKSAIVMDKDSKRVLYNQNINETMLIASTTKIMTAIVTIENTNILKSIVIDEGVLKSYGSSIYLSVGETISIENLLYGLLLRSGNDAALVLSNYVGGSELGFSYLMNEKAKLIGMNNTHFINSSGLENNEGIGNTSTSYDMALLMQYALNNKTFSKIVSTKKKIVKTDFKTYEWNNKNKLLYSYKYITGGKTGFTEKARRTLVTSASKNNKNLIIVTLNDPNDFKDHLDLYETFFKKYNKYKILDKKDIFKDRYYKNNELYIKNNFYMLMTKKENSVIDIKLVLDKKDNYKNNDLVGYFLISLNNNNYYENVYVRTIKHKKSFFTKLKEHLW